MYQDIQKKIKNNQKKISVIQLVKRKKIISNLLNKNEQFINFIESNIVNLYIETYTNVPVKYNLFFQNEIKKLFIINSQKWIN